MNPPADEEIPLHLHDAGLCHLYQIIQNLIRHLFMKGSLIAVGPKVKFQGFQFDAEFVRGVTDPEGCKIGLSGSWTKTGKFGALKLNFIVPVWVWIRKDFKSFGGFCRHGQIKHPPPPFGGEG